MAHTRTPLAARSRAHGSVMATIAPLDAAYAACPTCARRPPSKRGDAVGNERSTDNKRYFSPTVGYESRRGIGLRLGGENQAGCQPKFYALSSGDHSGCMQDKYSSLSVSERIA